jgi:antagonist of KipI
MFQEPTMCTVMDPGFLSTVQDEGRIGYRAFGVPAAGVMDRYASVMANILAGNPRGAATLEMTLRGGRFRFARTEYVAVCGADMQGELNGNRIRNWSGFSIGANDELAFAYAVSGCRSYVAFRGGIDVPIVMGSRSTCLRARFGGFQGRALQAGDVLPIPRALAPASSEPVELASELVPRYTNKVRLRAMLGPQDDLFTADGIHTFFHGQYTVSARNDRMGYVLQGPRIAHKGGADIVSDALCPGAVQVPGDGTPIVLAADCQTTGGYAKIATVIGADLWRLAQTKAGDNVAFVQCNDEEAVAALLAERQHYRRAARERDAIGRSEL